MFPLRPLRLYGRIPRGPLQVDWSNGLTAGLKAFWTFDATQGGFVDVAHHKTLTPTGSPTIVPSPAGPTARFNGSSQYIASASDTFLDGDDLVIIVGATPRGSLVQFAPIIARWNEATGVDRIFSIVTNNTSGAIRADTGNGGSDLVSAITGNGLLVLNKRVVIGYLSQGTAHGTNQPAQAAVWVDGVRQAQTLSAFGNALTGHTTATRVGSAQNWSSSLRFGQFDIDFVAIWNRYMMPAQLSSLTLDPGQILLASQPTYDSPTTAPPPPLWRFRPIVDDEFPDWVPPKPPAIGDTVSAAQAEVFWRFRTTVDDEFLDWLPPRPLAIGEPPAPPMAEAWRRFLARDEDEPEPWYPSRPRTHVFMPTPAFAGRRGRLWLWTEPETVTDWLPQNRRANASVRRWYPQIMVING